MIALPTFHTMPEDTSIRSERAAWRSLAQNSAYSFSYTKATSYVGVRPCRTPCDTGYQRQQISVSNKGVSRERSLRKFSSFQGVDFFTIVLVAVHTLVMASFMRITIRRIVLFFSFVLCIYGIHIALVQRSFEHYLTSLSITFDDFPSDYSEALIAAHQENRPIDYTNYASLHTNDSDANIPPIIHFIWFKNLYDSHLDVSEIPTHGSKAPEHCQQRNTNFTVNVWNATAARDLIEEHYEWFLPMYDGYKHPIQRVDAFKYFVIWHYGGVYMDLDIDCRRPLDPLLQFPAWFPKTALLGVNNDVFAARAQHPVIGEMTNQLTSRNVDLFFPYLTIYWSTGPQFTSDVLKSWFLSGRDEGEYKPGTRKIDAGKLSATIPLRACAVVSDTFAGLDRFYVLPEDFYSETYTFFGHSPGGTWHGDDVAVILWLVAHPWFVALIIVSAFACCLAIVVRRRYLKRRKRAYARVPGA